MSRLHRARLLGHAFCELVRYDVLTRRGGFPAVRKRMGAARSRRRGPGQVEAALSAVACATSFYWKPLLCLQRSVVTARLLRAEGIAADVVIGCRTRPFFSHAWVEVDGRVVNDSPEYPKSLQPLDRF